MSAPPRRLGHPRCALGESPRWAHGRWWWVDAERGVVWSADGDFGDLRGEVDAGPRTSLVHPATGGRMVVARGTELLVFDPADGSLRAWAAIPLEPGWLLNDGTADGAGALWIGSVHPDRRPGSGLLHRVDRRGEVTTFRSGAALSNGMAWLGSGRLILADSLARTLTEYRVDGSDGPRSAGAWELPPQPGTALPDGLCRDVEGGVWVALYGSGTVARFVGGRPAEVVEVPTPQVTSAALGGPDGRDLLVTTAQEGMDRDARAADRDAGALFAARVGIPGEPLPAAGPFDPA